MSAKPVIVAVNGSPHAGFGNTSIMLEMMRPPLVGAGFDLEVIDLAAMNIRPCIGCAFCMEKGRCWIDDDHRQIVERLLAADGVVLASPVYFLHVTGQMKTFLDRCLAFGHKPRPTWKPGLAVCVSAGMGETDTANYLAFVLRTFGAFSVGTLTAMATQPGGFLGKEAVQGRARDLAGDLARAIKEKRRYPATERDLHFYQFMGSLVKSEKDLTMKHDYKHWQEHGFYDSFEKYVQQETAQVPFDSKMREAWIQEMIERQKTRKKEQAGAGKKEPGKAAPLPQTCQELIQSMPLAFHPEAAGDLKAILQFEVKGEENFTAHLEISEGRCAYHGGPADKPNLIIHTPADVWLKIARGELNGQKAFMDGLYRVEGDMNLLLKLNRLFAA